MGKRLPETCWADSKINKIVIVSSSWSFILFTYIDDARSDTNQIDYWELFNLRTGYIKCKYHGFQFCIGPPEILLYMQRSVSCEVWGSDDCGGEDSRVFWDLTLCRRVHVSPRLVPVYLSLKMEALGSFEASGSVTQRHGGTTQITLIFNSNHFLVDVSWHK